MDTRCDAVQELLPLLLNRSLSSQETVAALDHIKECARCKRELAFLATVKKSAVVAWPMMPDPAFSAQLWSRIQEAQFTTPARASEPGWIAITWSSMRYVFSPLAPVYDALHIAWRSLRSILPRWRVRSS